MGVKYCKACKKPMKSTETHCRTCGAEYKNSPVILIVILLILIGLCVFTWSKYHSNKVELENQAQYEKNKQIDEAKLDLQEKGISPDVAQKVAEIKSNETKTFSEVHLKEFENILSEWSDAERVAGSTSRISLAQPVSRLQEIKRKADSLKYSGCLEASRLLYLTAMNSHIDGYLEFMKGKESELAAQLKFIDYAKQLEQAENEFKKCQVHDEK
ncbi:hypothetical protein B9T27_14545 [Acinetobacter sp. ANC 4648]|nr:hypothetical protein B9T27_14545 [Acinetobacter sp. ANC 4648]